MRWERVREEEKNLPSLLFGRALINIVVDDISILNTYYTVLGFNTFGIFTK
jgi:hypothetical protein